MKRVILLVVAIAALVIPSSGWANLPVPAHPMQYTTLPIPKHQKPITFAGLAALTKRAQAQARLHKEAVGTQTSLGLQMFMNAFSYRCMGVHYASTSPGALVYQGQCNSGASDQWWDLKFVYQTPTGYWYAINNHSHLCLSFNNDSYSNGTSIIQWWCDATSDYDILWMNSVGPGSDFVIAHGMPLKTYPMHVIEDKAWSQVTSPLDEWSYLGYLNQKWVNL